MHHFITSAVALPLALSLSLVLLPAGSASAEYEQPEYEILQTDGDFEIRQYSDAVVVETVAEGSRNDASSSAFFILFDYINGANEAKLEIPMTAPVTQQPTSVEIPMTAPVTQQPTPEGAWNVAFYLPSEYTMDTAPTPTDQRVSLRLREGKKAAAVRFSGRWTDKKFQRKAQELRDWLEKSGVVYSEPPVYAYYNSPMRLWFMRRNEVLFTLPQ